jgi:hypothetical protein
MKTKLQFQLVRLFLLFSIILVNPLSGQTFKVDTLQFKGDINKYVNVVILGDGYASNEQNLLKSDATNYMNNFMFSQTPYKEYKNFFNVFLIEVISPQSGIKHPRTASDCPAASSHPQSNPNNYFGTTFDLAGIHRLVSPNDESKVVSVLSANTPYYDQAYIIANSAQYGGAGGQFATFTTNAQSGEIGLHEGGHSFGALADEYWAGAQYAMEKPNMTKETDGTKVKWKNWMNVNGIGIYPHSGDASWKKPRTGECKMELLGKPFCSVCSETIVEKIHSLVQPIYAQDPVQTNLTVSGQQVNFSIQYMMPIANTVSRRWILDGFASAKNNVSVVKWTTSGNVLAFNKDAYTLNTSNLSNGSHKLRVYTIDSTSLTRSDAHPGDHIDSVIWTLNVSPNGIEVNQDNGASVKIYPNPVKSDLNVSYFAEKDRTVVTNVYAIDGKRLLTFVDKVGSGETKKSIEMGHLPSGTYLIEVISDGVSITHQIVKE